MKFTKKSHKKVHKASRRRSHKKRRTGHKNVGKNMEISPISKNVSPHSLDNSPAFNMSPEHEDSPEESVHSYSNMASQLDGGPSPMDASPTDTTIESMEVDSPDGNDDTMDTDELVGPSPTNSSANTTRDRSTGGSKKRKRRSRRKR